MTTLNKNQIQNGVADCFEILRTMDSPQEAAATLVNLHFQLINQMFKHENREQALKYIEAYFIDLKKFIDINLQ